MVDFPRVLFVTPVAFNPYAGGGATFASLFQGWPKDRLATVHNDPAPSPKDTCEQYFTLGPDEIDFVWPFNILRQTVTAPGRSGTQSGPRLAYPRHWIRSVREFILGDSVPERAQLTPRLSRWIEHFRPDVIYTILGSNGLMSLVEDIHRKFALPLVVHIMDDWASAAHRKGLFATRERRRMQLHLTDIFAAATSCLGISTAMCEAFGERYGRPFRPFQYAFDFEAWGSIQKREFGVKPVPDLLYVGSIFKNAQLESLVDCARAIAILNDTGFPIRLRIATSAANKARFGASLMLHPNIAIDTSSADDAAFFQALADADALLLPVNFDHDSVEFIRYSMPTKVPAYLNSGTPILAYGAPQTAQMRYADDGGWALTVTERSQEKLAAAVKRIMGDQALRKALSDAARATACNHDARRVRLAFQNVLRQSAHH